MGEYRRKAKLASMIFSLATGCMGCGGKKHANAEENAPEPPPARTTPTENGPVTPGGHSHTATFFSTSSNGCWGSNEIAIILKLTDDLAANQGLCDQATQSHFSNDGGHYAWVDLDGKCQKWDVLLKFNELCHRVVESLPSRGN